MFGRKGAAQSPEPVVDWRGIREFEITTALRRGAGNRGRDHGRLAVRVPAPGGSRGAVALRPCAFFSPNVTQPVAASRAYTDEAATQVLLEMVKDRHAEGGEVHHRVRDAAGTELGLIRRIPPRSARGEHSWRIEQPGRPPIEAGPGLAATGARFLANALTAVFGSEDADVSGQPGRFLAWHTVDGGRRGERVMTSRAHGPVMIEADWLDRRLAIAYAMLLDR